MGKHYEQLTAEERAAIMMMKASNCSARHMARVLHRVPSTITRELARFAAWPDRATAMADTPAQYDARAAGLRARRQRFKCRKRSKLVTDTVLFGVVQHFLAQGWSPSQITGTLKRMWPDEPLRTVSHEGIYTCIYAMPKGELRKDLIVCLRRAKAKRVPRSGGEDRRGRMPDLLSIHVRPPEASDQVFPGYWEGDLIKGAGNRTAVGVLLERSSRLVMLIKLTDATAASALEGFTAKLRSIAEPVRQTLTYDRGREMARHAGLTANTGVMVYFCNPHSSWQRGSCENTNGLIRQFLPKVTDLSVHSQEQLDAIADLLNNRPRAAGSIRPLPSTKPCWTSSINPTPQFNKSVLHLVLDSANYIKIQYKNNAVIGPLLKIKVLISPLQYYSRRMAGVPPTPFSGMAHSNYCLGSAGRIAAIRPIIWPSHLARITGAAIGLSTELLFKNLHREEFQWGSVEIHKIRDVALLNDVLYFPHYRVKLGWLKGEGENPIVSWGEVDSASLAATSTGSRWFGHWLWDELTLQALTMPYGQPVAHQRINYFHESGIRQAVGLQEPHRFRSAWFSQLTVATDPPVSPHKTRRIFSMRERLSTLPYGKKKIFLIRGFDGEKRLLANQEQLSIHLERAGFITFCSDGKTFAEVLHICNGADLLVTVEGSHAVPALLYMRTGGCMVILNPPNRCSTILPDLGLFVGLRGGMFVGEPVENDEASFKVDPNELMHFIDYVERVARAGRIRHEIFLDELLSS